eukprot:XP_025010316.1 NADH dehydrogenase [ubiquinone] 1 alpha subcomplex assembly factor 3 isoform X1 [Gallus gallus]
MAAALRRLCRAGPRAVTGAPRRGHRLTPSDDEMYQRTRVTVLQPESPNVAFIEGYSGRGFSISGSVVVGPCAVLPRAILQWNVGSHRDISLQSLALFRLLEPRIAERVRHLQLPDEREAPHGRRPHPPAGRLHGAHSAARGHGLSASALTHPQRRGRPTPSAAAAGGETLQDGRWEPNCWLSAASRCWSAVGPCLGAARGEYT